MESEEKPPITSTNGDVGVDTTQSGQDSIMQMLSLISTTMMGTIQDLQRQLAQNELKFTSELQRISQDNERFRQEIIFDMHCMHSSPGVTSSITTAPSPVLNNSTTPGSSSVTSPIPTSMVTLSNPQDFQNQMLTVLMETISNLTTVMSETKTNETKSDWPKFSGDTKKFFHWYLDIVAQLLLAPWKEFYDSTTNPLVKTTLNTSLDEKLYAKLLLCLEGQVFQVMVSRKHLHANGLLMLTELSQTYRPSQVPEVTAAKMVEFWSSMKCLLNESVDMYYNRFQSLLDDLEEAGEPISLHSAVRQFLFTLGSDFAPIQNNYRSGLLPDAWKTTDWPTLLVLCQDYANLVRPQSHKSDSCPDHSFDRSAHHKKVKQWFMNPAKLQAEIEAEQAKHVGECLYHLTKSHPTMECYIKKECDKLLANKSLLARMSHLVPLQRGSFVISKRRLMM